MKTPEEYFEEQNFDSEEQTKQADLSAREKLFIDKYLGGQTSEIKAALADEPVPESVLNCPQDDLQASKDYPCQAVPQGKKTDQVLSDRERLKAREEVQLVSFFMGRQEYALPIETVKEVIKYIKPTKLPAAPEYLEGVINLRQRVTPIVKLARLLNPGKADQGEDRFIVVCHQDGLQVGLLVERIATMYRMPREDIEWNVESALAMTSSFVSALIKNREKIISILSIDTIVNHLLSEK
ncbi:MAG: purine-binding chemotaxis protein CheW [Desulfonatronovibrio sp. MSAO_Bac4]|nr:MAG: purine-binding chemotaxis protein CheW [Desulfonatronovibrio sp. MSAO_Bac4]